MLNMVLFAVLYVVFGVVVMAGYAANWRTAPKLRHIAVWPVIHGAMLAALPPPRWAGPATRDADGARLRRQILDRNHLSR